MPNERPTVEAVAEPSRVQEAERLKWECDTGERAKAVILRLLEERDEAIAGQIHVVHGEACTPETCSCFRLGLESLISARCRKHYAIPPLNREEHSGAECGACIQVEADHEWAQWAEKWQAAMDLVGMRSARVSQLEQEIAALREWENNAKIQRTRAEAAEARVAALEKERDAYHERADAEQVAGIMRGEKAEKEASDLRAALRETWAFMVGEVPPGSQMAEWRRDEIRALLSAGEHDQEGR